MPGIETARPPTLPTYDETSLVYLVHPRTLKDNEGMADIERIKARLANGLLSFDE